MHNIENELISLGIISSNDIELYHSSVRDRADIPVYKCKKSGVIFIKDTKHIDGYYESIAGVSYWSATDRQEALKSVNLDDQRRFKSFQSLVQGKRYLDVGTGLGGALDLFSVSATKVGGIEPQTQIRELLQSIGYDMYASIESIPEDVKFDVITLFHVFEHLDTPLASLEAIYKRLEKGGKLIIEVPHANDALLSYYQLQDFKKFTLWSEHLILHTRNSLNTYLNSVGFSKVIIQGVQRYNLANHIGWIKNGKPAGQHEFVGLGGEDLSKEYENALKSMDSTDTLVAIAIKE